MGGRDKSEGQRWEAGGRLGEDCRRKAGKEGGGREGGGRREEGRMTERDREKNSNQKLRIDTEDRKMRRTTHHHMMDPLMTERDTQP